MKIQYTSTAFSGSIEVPDNVGLEAMQGLQLYVLSAAPHPQRVDQPAPPSPRSNHRRIFAKYRLDVRDDVPNRKLHLALSTGEQAEFDVPEPQDRPALDRLFTDIDTWGEKRELTRGQVAGVHVHLNQNFGVWRRGPRS